MLKKPTTANRINPHEAGAQDRLQVASVVRASEVLETGRPRGVGLRLWLSPRTGPTAIDIAIAITGFITEPSMMFSWNSACRRRAVHEAANQLVLAARLEYLRRVDPNPHAIDVDRVAVDDDFPAFRSASRS